MFLADRNVFGVDLNLIAVELGEVSLWLNTIVPGGFVPWFGLQLRCGNSLVGTKRAVFRADQLLKESNNTWLASVPERVPLHQPKIDGRKNYVFHFLLPDTGMANYTDKEIKKQESRRLKAMNEWRIGFSAPFTGPDVQAVKQLTMACESLWQTYADHLQETRARTTDPLDIRGYTDSEHTQSDLLPTRDEWLIDLDFVLTSGTTRIAQGQQQDFFAKTLKQEYREKYVNELGIVDMDELIREIPRFKTIKECARQYKFFHWELEFADIFKNHGGFDLILGNPPWIKVEWNEGGILSDYEPSYTIKKLPIASHTGEPASDNYDIITDTS